MADETKRLLGDQDSNLDDKSLTQSAVVKDRIDESVLKNRKVQYHKLPIGIWILEKLGLLNFKSLLW